MLGKQYLPARLLQQSLVAGLTINYLSGVCYPSERRRGSSRRHKVNLNVNQIPDVYQKNSKPKAPASRYLNYQRPTLRKNYDFQE